MHYWENVQLPSFPYNRVLHVYIHMWCTYILTTVNTTQRKTKNDVIGLAMTTKVTRNTTAIASRIFLKSSSAMT